MTSRRMILRRCGIGWSGNGGPHRLAGTIQRIRTVFKYGYEAGLIDKPVRYGPQFKKPSKRVMRCHKAQAGSKMFETAELRQLLATDGHNSRR